MRNWVLLLTISIFLGWIGHAHAGPISGSVWVGLTDSDTAINSALIANIPARAPDATFSPAAIDFDSRVTGYTIGEFLNHPTFSNTTALWTSNGKSAASLDDTFFLFTGTTFLKKGANKFVTPHDDGFELLVTGAFSDAGLTTPFDLQQGAPTSPIDTPYTVFAPADGDYSFTLTYAEGFGPPGVLSFLVNDSRVVGTPEPATLSLLGIGLACMAGYGLRRRKLSMA